MIRYTGNYAQLVYGKTWLVARSDITMLEYILEPILTF